MEKYELDRSHGALPLYEQILKIEREKFRYSKYAYRQLMPSEEEMQEMYGVSRVTIRKVFDLMVQERTVQRIKGRGTIYICRQRFDEDILNSRGFEDTITESRKKSVVKSAHVKKIYATDMQAETFSCNLHDIIYEIERVKAVNDELICYSEIYISGKYDMPLDDSKYYGSIPYLIKQNGISDCKRAKKTIEAMQTTAYIAKKLDIPSDRAILRRNTEIFDSNDKLVVYASEYFDASQYRFTYDTTNF